MHEQIGNIFQAVENTKNSKVQMLEMQSLVRERDSVFDGPISRLNTAMNRTNKFKAKSLENHPIWKWRKKKQTEHLRA